MYMYEINIMIQMTYSRRALRDISLQLAILFFGKKKSIDFIKIVRPWTWQEGVEGAPKPLLSDP